MFNVAADGIVLLSQAIAIMGGKAVPVLPPYGRWLGRLALRAAGVDVPEHITDVLAFGSVAEVQTGKPNRFVLARLASASQVTLLMLS